MNTNTCHTCQYWEGHNRSCHRFPPTPMGWLTTDPLAWCGEHRLRQEDAAQELKPWQVKGKRR